MRNGKTDSERAGTAEFEQTASSASAGDSSLRRRWNGLATDDEPEVEEMKERLMRCYLRSLENVDRNLRRLEEMDSPIESSNISVGIEQKGSLLVEIELSQYPHYSLPQPQSVRRRCEDVARRVAGALRYEPERIHVAVLGAECVDEWMVNLEIESEG